MNVRFANHKIIAQHEEGKCTGIFAVTSKYKVDFFVPRGQSYALFYVIGLLTIDFMDGGEKSFECSVTYNLSHFNQMPDIEALVELAHVDAPRKLEEMFVSYNLWTPHSTKDDLWVPYEKKQLRILIAEALTHRFDHS